jgi:hypothetical protein
MMNNKLKLSNVVAIAICLAGVTMFASCDKEEKESENSKGNETTTSNNTETTSTETTAEFDNSSFGLYKGVIVGSTGNIKIEINNGNNTAKAYISIDGQNDELTTTYTFANGQAIVNAAFNGTLSNFTFSVDADGKNPVIANINIEGHSNVDASVFKETSVNVASAYEGTLIGGNNASGTINVVRNNNSFSAISANHNDGGKSVILNGTINADGSFSASKTVENYHPGLNVMFNVSGTFNGNQVSGTWNNSWGEGETNSGTFSGQKTL